MSDLQELVRQSQAERIAFIRHGEVASPACVELFRRAFADDRLAWEAIFAQVFPQEIRRYIQAAARSRQAQGVAPFSPADLEDAVQEAQLAFYHYAPKAPTLLASGDLAPIIAYLKTCTMSAVATVARKLPPPAEAPLSALAGEDNDDGAAENTGFGGKLPLSTLDDFTVTMTNVGAILAELQKILQTDVERLIAQECFLNDTPPRELVVDHAHLFPGGDTEAKLKYLNQALKRIRLRAEKSPTFQNLRSARRKSEGAAFLTYSVADLSTIGEAMMPGVEPCAFDEATLLEYIQGNVPAEQRAAIERAPACVEAARHLAQDVEVLRVLLRLSPCPAVETLLAYHAKALPSAQQLIVRKHLQICNQCQREIAMFAAIDDVTLQEAPSQLRRFFEALFLPPTLSVAPVRGTLPSVQYRTQIRTPAIDIFIFTQKTTGKGRTWTLRGELRTEEGLQFTQVEQLILRTAEPLAATAPVEITTTLDEDGMFVFRGLDAGVYALQVFTDEEEILIRALKVGEDG